MFAALSILAIPVSAQTVVLVPIGSTWKYLDNGSNQGTSWRSTNYNDGSWASGPAELGYGDGFEATTNKFGSDSNNKYITTYYRRAFVVTNRASLTNLAVRLMRDDGAVVYLNGVEVFRSNLPEGGILYDTYASRSIGGLEESTYFSCPIPPSRLQGGSNWLAVEVHQSDPGSSDLSFNLELLANTSYGNLPPSVTLFGPPPGGLLQTNQVFTLSAAAADSDSEVTSLEFFQDGGLIRTFSQTSSASFSWSNAVQGMHTYFARAVDKEGAAGTSAPVRILLPRAFAQTTFYPSFNTGALTLQGSASVVSNHLRLTPNRRAQIGGAWLSSKRSVTEGFETIFQFRITDLFTGGADGIGFVMAGTSGVMLGGGDNNLGFGGITNSLAVSLDTWVNDTDSIGNDNHISIQSRGLLGNTGDAAGVMAYNTSLPDMSDGAVHTLKIDYAQQQLRVFLDNMNTPVVALGVDLNTLLYLPDGTAWVGFTAATGWMAETHDIMAWSFASLTNPLPTITLSSPSNATRCAPGTNLLLRASLDALLGVAQVEFFDGTLRLGGITNAPYSWTLDNIPAGYHSFTAKVTDNQGHTAVSAPVLVFSLPPDATVLAYSDFSSPTGLTFQGAATLSTNRIRITPSSANLVGGVWLEQKQMLQDGFECAFQFQIGELVEGGADGLAFVIQNNPVPLLGPNGRWLGYDQVSNSLVVEFDTRANPEEAPLTAPHVAIHSRGQDPNSCEAAGLLAYADSSKLLDGAVHTALIRYQPGYLRVFLDDLDAPLIKAAVRLDTWMDLDEGRAWVGFTASTSSARESHDLLAWTFRSNILPWLAFAEPVDSNVFPAGASIRLLPKLYDPDGSIARVDYFVQGAPLASAAQSPFEFVWENVPVGDYILAAQATDDFGAVSTLTTAHVSVLDRPMAECLFSPADQTVHLRFLTLAGRNYRVQYSSDLVAWHDTLLTILGDGGYMEWQDNGPPISESLPLEASRRFYRIAIVP